MDIYLTHVQIKKKMDMTKKPCDRNLVDNELPLLTLAELLLHPR